MNYIPFLSPLARGSLQTPAKKYTQTQRRVFGKLSLGAPSLKKPLKKYW